MGAFIERIGETRMMHCGMKATIIGYHNTSNIDVKFEDGTILENRTYNTFTTGRIHNPNLKLARFKGNRVGETRLMNCGMQATIIEYRSSSDIDIQFDDKTIVKHKTYDNFINGAISNSKTYKGRIGESQLMNCGMQAKIIAYRSYKDIDIQFEDGTIIENRSYYEFMNGLIRNPNLPASKFNDRTGETRIMHCGMKATIIRYEKSSNIDVEFEDGTIVKNRSYISFRDGTLRNPNLHSQKFKDRTGETRTMYCGLKATILNYRNSMDMDVQFEDKTIVRNRAYNGFVQGGIMYPNKNIGSIGIGAEVCRVKDKVYYNCTCQKCHTSMILTLPEMLQHHC